MFCACRTQFVRKWGAAAAHSYSMVASPRIKPRGNSGIAIIVPVLLILLYFLARTAVVDLNSKPRSPNVDVPATADQLQDGDRAGPQRTFMQCLGSQLLTRACHFQDIYYDLNSTRFVYYGTADSGADVFGDQPLPNDAWLRLTRCAQKKQFKKYVEVSCSFVILAIDA